MAAWTVINGWLRNQLNRIFDLAQGASNGQVLVFNAAEGRFEAADAGDVNLITVGGADTQVQFNDGGSFGGDAGLTYNKATDTLTVAGGIEGEELTLEGLYIDPDFKVNYASAVWPDGQGLYLTDESENTWIDLQEDIKNNATGDFYIWANKDGGAINGYAQNEVFLSAGLVGTTDRVRLQMLKNGHFKILGRVSGVEVNELDLDLSASGTVTIGGAATTHVVFSGKDVKAPNFLMGGVAFASLPVAPAAGTLAYVTDSNTVVWGDTIAGGDTNKVLAWFNGTNWTVAGK